MKQLICKIKGHTLFETSKAGIHIKQYECSNCREKFTTDGYGKMVKFNRYWEKNHEFFQSRLQKN